MRLSWFGIALATASLSLLANHAQAASKETVLHSFGAGVDGITPEGGLISDAAGNLYGITSQGGRASFGGTVFKLAPPAAGKSTWTESVLHSFAGTPEAGLIIDKAGNLYGTTGFGGVPSKKCANGCGTVFKLTPPPAGKAAWTETVLFSFNDIDGSLPAGRLVFDAAGNLYGTTEDGGSLGYGTVFKLTPPAAGKTAWMETVLFSFSDTDGADPQAGLIFDKAGNLYGTT